MDHADRAVHTRIDLQEDAALMRATAWDSRRYWHAVANWHRIWLPICAGLIFVGLFQWRYAGIDPDFYQFRDDGIITLSHARNWIDFGFIGVNPSGERIEAYSAPAQMLLYALAYGVTGLDFKTFITLQTVLCTFALGALFSLFFEDRPLFAVLACAAIAAALTRLASFMEWHGSGMENALTHVLLLGTVLLLYRCARDRRIRMRWAVVPFIASISRIEGIVHVAPLMLVFCIYWQARERNDQARRFATWVAALWLLFNMWRFFYFGALLPNTAVAQGISVGDRLVELVTLSPTYLDQSFSLARTIFSAHGGYLLLLVLPFVLFRQRDDMLALLLAFAASLVLTHLASPFIFGPARLDTTRTTTPMAVFVVFAVAAAFYRSRLQEMNVYVLGASATLVFLLHEYSGWQPYRVCCSHVGFENVRKTFEGIGRSQGITRPTVANPDLGVVSWYKQFNIVDIGLLGSPVFARLQTDRALNEYFFGYAAPDLIESHGFWTCKYKALLTDPRFTAMYAEAFDPGAHILSCQGTAVPTGYWVRRDVMRASRSAERALIDDLRSQPSAERVGAELHACQAAGDASPSKCAYVARSAYRFLPELRARGELPALERIFEGSKSRDFDLYLMTGFRDARAYVMAIRYLQRQ
jgi:hypothetical protein